jgi:sugar-specific transcriptional regulator TrmB
MLTIKGEDIEALTSLGLTALQAKVYLVLNTLGKATIKTIAKMANVARQDTYRITSELQELSIIEKIIATPTEFRAASIEDGIDILVQRKHRESSQAHAKAMQFLQRHKHDRGDAEPEEQTPQFALVPENEALVLKLKRGAETAQRSIDTTVTWKKFSQGIDILSEAYHKAMRRGVEIRVVVEKPE